MEGERNVGGELRRVLECWHEKVSFVVSECVWAPGPFQSSSGKGDASWEALKHTCPPFRWDFSPPTPVSINKKVTGDKK